MKRISKRGESIMKTDVLIGDLGTRIKQRRTAAPEKEKEIDAEDHFTLSLALEI